MEEFRKCFKKIMILITLLYDMLISTHDKKNISLQEMLSCNLIMVLVTCFTKIVIKCLVTQADTACYSEPITACSCEPVSTLA